MTRKRVITRAGFIFRVLRLLVHYFKLNNHLMFWKMCWKKLARSGLNSFASYSPNDSLSVVYCFYNIDVLTFPSTTQTGRYFVR